MNKAGEQAQALVKSRKALKHQERRERAKRRRKLRLTLQQAKGSNGETGPKPDNRTLMS